jgi:hypothetical protein
MLFQEPALLLIQGTRLELPKLTNVWALRQRSHAIASAVAHRSFQQALELLAQAAQHPPFRGKDGLFSTPKLPGNTEAGFRLHKRSALIRLSSEK